MNIGEILTPLTIGAVGGLISAGVTYVFSRRGRRESLQDARLLETSAEVATNARLILHLSSQLPKSKGMGAAGLTAQLDEAHSGVRVGCTLLSLVGKASVQESARLVRHHAYAVVKVAQGDPDPHPEYGISAYTRFELAIQMLLEGTRDQLGVSGHVVRRFDLARLTSESSLRS